MITRSGVSATIGLDTSADAAAILAVRILASGNADLRVQLAAFEDNVEREAADRLSDNAGIRL